MDLYSLKFFGFIDFKISVWFNFKLLLNQVFSSLFRQKINIFSNYAYVSTYIDYVANSSHYLGDHDQI